MTKTRGLTLLLLAIASTAAIAACGGGAPQANTAPAPTAAATDTAAERRAREEAAQRESARLAADAAAARQRAIDDSIANAARMAEETMRRESDALRATLTGVITFEFNKSDLRDDAKAALDAKIPILMTNGTVTIRIAGHADERGSTEYNLALGTQRAATAKRYLVDRGVPANRIETTSFGEERPVCTEANDMCWGQNRRDEFELTAGGPMLTKPRS